jgi:hypothetical protein
VAVDGLDSQKSNGGGHETHPTIVDEGEGFGTVARDDATYDAQREEEGRKRWREYVSENGRRRRVGLSYHVFLPFAVTHGYALDLVPRENDPRKDAECEPSEVYEGDLGVPERRPPVAFLVEHRVFRVVDKYREG